MAPTRQHKKRDARSSEIHRDNNALFGDKKGLLNNGNDVYDDAFEPNAKDEAEAVRRYEERKLVTKENEVMARFRRLRARASTRAEAEFIEDMHNNRLKTIQRLRAADEAEYKISQPSEAVQQPVPRTKRDFREESYGMEKEQNKVTELSLSMSITGGQTPNGHKTWYDLHTTPIKEVSPPELKRPRLWSIDSEAAPPFNRKRSPPRMTCWRHSGRKRTTLNRDLSRIKTEFILSDDFVDDVNYMLDFIENMHWGSFWNTKRSFEKDIDNQDRVVKFVEHGDREWGVHLRRPDNTDADPLYDDDQPEIAWLTDNGHLPQACRIEGCDDGCPRKISFNERKADLEKFREGQVMPPPPIPRRLNCEKAPRPQLKLNVYPPRPASRFGHMFPAHYASNESSRGIDSRANFDATPQYIEDVEQENTAIEEEKWVLGDQIKQVDNEMGRVKAQLRKSLGREPTHQQVLQEWLRLRQTNAGFRIPQDQRKDSVIDTKGFRPIGGKPIHNEKIPSGPKSIFAEDIRTPKASSVYDERYTVPELKDEEILNRPRNEYYAARILERRSVSPLSPVGTQKFEICPEWEKHPGSYWELQKTKIEPVSQKRKQRRSEKVQSGMPNEGAMMHLQNGHFIGAAPERKQAIKRLVAQIQESARRSSGSTSAFGGYPKDITPCLPKFPRPFAEPAVVPEALHLSPPSSPAPPSRPQHAVSALDSGLPAVRFVASATIPLNFSRSAASPLLTHVEDHGIPVWDPDRHPSRPAAPQICDDMDVDSGSDDEPVDGANDDLGPPLTRVPNHAALQQPGGNRARFANQPNKSTDRFTSQQPVDEGAWLSSSSTKPTSSAPRPLSPIEAEKQKMYPKTYAQSVLNKFNKRWQRLSASQHKSQRASQRGPSSMPTDFGGGGTSISVLTSSLSPPTAATLRREGATVRHQGSRKAKLKAKGEDRKALQELFKKDT